MATADASDTIAESLKETDEIPRKQISEIVSVLGSDIALELLAETRKVQDSGGVEVRDGTRRRTDGGVFFSLAKARLPKPDRNRIFRIRPPKPEGEEGENPPVSETAATEPRPLRAAPSAKPSFETSSAGRRRVVEVEVLRKPGGPAPVILPIRDVAPPPRPEPRVVHEDRPLRRLVVGSANREEPPATVEAARERIRSMLEKFSAADRRSILVGLLEGNGGVEHPPPPSSVDDKLREQVLASVTDALGLSSGDLARVLYGDENPSARSKARLALDRWKKAREA